MASLRERLAAAGGTTAPATTPAPIAPAVTVAAPPPAAHVVETAPAPEIEDGDLDFILGAIINIDVEAVVGGALQRISFTAGTNPAHIALMLRTLDPNCKVRDAFPMKSFGGNRETKTARCISIQLKVSPTGKFIDLTCQNGEDFIVVGVSKKNADTFFDNVKALGKLHEGSIARMQTAFTKADGIAVPIMLAEDEMFGVGYWTTEDGKAFLENMNAEPPAPATAKGAAHV